MATFARALLPSDDVLAAWSEVKDAMAWAGVSAELWEAVAKELGDESLKALPIIAGMQPLSFRAAVDGAGATAVAKVKLGLLYAAVRLKYGMPATDVFQEAPPAAPAAAAPASSGGGGGAPLKVRVSTIMDQSSDREFELLPEDRLRTLRANFRASEGDAPMESEEVTDEQLSAFVRVVEAGGAPFVDFGIWGPYGNRIAKTVKFTHHFLDGAGQWRARELPGPDCYAAWERGWRVFRTAAIMAQIATPAVLDTYAMRFKARCDKFSWAWDLCCLADSRCRSEWWTHELRRQVTFHTANPGMSAFQPTQPWNSVVKAAAVAPAFWKDELEDDALIRRVGAAGGAAAASGGPPPPPPRAWDGGSAAAGSGKRKRGNRDRGAGGGPSSSSAPPRDRVPGGGKEICFAWNKARDGCQDVCPSGRAHVCRVCLQPHRAVDCPKAAPGDGKTGGGGKGGGRGGGKRR